MAERRAKAIAAAAEKLRLAIQSEDVIEDIDKAIVAYERAVSSASGMNAGAGGVLFSAQQVRTQMVEKRAEKMLQAALASDDLGTLAHALNAHAHEASVSSVSLAVAQARRQELAAEARTVADAERKSWLARRLHCAREAKAQIEADELATAKYLSEMRRGKTEAAVDQHSDIAVSVRLWTTTEGVVCVDLTMKRALLQSIAAERPGLMAKRSTERHDAEAALRTACMRGGLEELKASIHRHAPLVGPESKALQTARELRAQRERSLKAQSKQRSRKERAKESASARRTDGEAERNTVAWLSGAMKRAEIDELEEAIAAAVKHAPHSVELQQALAKRQVLRDCRAERLLRSAIEISDAGLLQVQAPSPQQQCMPSPVPALTHLGALHARPRPYDP